MMQESWKKTSFELPRRCFWASATCRLHVKFGSVDLPQFFSAHQPLQVTNFETSKYLPSSLFPHSFTEGVWKLQHVFCWIILWKSCIDGRKKNISSDINLALFHPPRPARSILVCEPTIALFVVPQTRWVMDVRGVQAISEGPKVSGKEKKLWKILSFSCKLRKLLWSYLRYRNFFPKFTKFLSLASHF